MDVFFVDLDNTLVYSYKHEIGKDKRKAELYQGRQVSFMTEKTYRLLQKLKERICIVPVTTRTMEQYSRIDLGIGNIKYALVCNGGVLLVNGRQEQTWYAQSLKMTEESQAELEHAMRYLEGEKNRIFETRLIQRLFVFTKCRSAKETVQRLGEALHPLFTEVFYQGEKVYVVPKNLDKGTAAARFKEYIGADRVFAAGDSEFDIPMLRLADIAAAPAGCGWADSLQGGGVHEMPGKHLFSEELLEFVSGYV